MITLINPPGLKSLSGLQMHTPNPPLGLAYIAGALKANGLSYRVIDAVGEGLDQVSPYPARDDLLVQGISIEDLVDRIPADTDVIGVACMFSTLWPLCRMISDAIRPRFPDVLLVLGGEHGTAVPEVVLESSEYDVIILGEGEETFIKLIGCYRDGGSFSDVEGISYREEGNIHHTGLSPRTRDIDGIAEPDWGSFPIGEYIDRHQINGIRLGRSMPILATRGCPYRCAFCSNPGMWTARYITRDVKKLVDEIEKYTNEYDVTNFDFQDLTAVIKRHWVIEFTNELIRRNLNITWQMPSGTRAEIFDDDIIDLLYRSGCRAFAFAPESGSEEMLKMIRKQVNLKKMTTAMRSVVKRGFKLSAFIVIGFPDETSDTLKQTMKLVRRMAVLGLHDVAVTKFVPYPGSEFFKRLQDEGKIHLDDKFFVSPMDFYTQNAPSYAEAISTKRLYWTMIWMFVNFYVISFSLRPFRVIRILAKATFGGTEETRYAKWFVDRLFTRRRWRKNARNLSGHQGIS